MNKKLTKFMCISLILLGLTSPMSAYPPDNAAVLYYKACLLYDPDKPMCDMIADYAKGEDSFILRCQGKELGKDKIHEYEFKIAE